MLFVWSFNTFLISICLLVHFESLVRISSYLKDLEFQGRLKVLLALLGVLLAHIAEVWIFAVGYFIYDQLGQYGELTGNFNHVFLDYTYYSFVTYTSLGLGDIVPTQHLRFLTGLEALVGLVLIAWSASFMYFQMERFWRD